MSSTTPHKNKKFIPDDKAHYNEAFGRHDPYYRCKILTGFHDDRDEKYCHRVVMYMLNKYFDLETARVQVHLNYTYEDLNCYGMCEEGLVPNTYIIHVARDQTLRDWVATLVHEMIHVNQWETNEWSDDGEKECNDLQYKITDLLWKEGVL